MADALLIGGSAAPALALSKYAIGQATVSGTALDCGHLLPEERPDRVIAELRNFFRV